MVSFALKYLREIASSLDRGYPDSCVTHACRLAELLLAEKKEPWIARLRDTRNTPEGVFHGPLTPRRLAGPGCPTWTTHYVVCEAGYAYDPLAGAPMPLADYARSVFGRELAIEVFLDAACTEEHCRYQTLPAAFLAKSVGAPDHSA